MPSQPTRWANSTTPAACPLRNSLTDHFFDTPVIVEGDEVPSPATCLAFAFNPEIDSARPFGVPSLSLMFSRFCPKRGERSPCRRPTTASPRTGPQQLQSRSTKAGLHHIKVPHQMKENRR